MTICDSKFISNKRQELENIKSNLKSQFIGLDKIIDKVINSIEVWYIFPDLLTTPLIINLWGMTGVGKTDLIRKLVRELNFQDRYVEVQLNNDNSSKTIQDTLLYSNISHNHQSILLLDEIQRFRSIDEENKSKNNSNYSDIWELLSDGSFSDAFKELEELQIFLFEMLYDRDYYLSRKNKTNDGDLAGEYEEEQEGSVKRKYKQSTWMASKFKRITGSNLNIEEIMKLSTNEQIEMLEKTITSIKVNKEIKKYKKLLIFICGNLDEAYYMARNTSDVDSDADILHEKSKCINIIDIKSKLKLRFTPEQISRFGNNHIIYPSLSKKNFQDLISIKLDSVKENFRKVSDIRITFDPSIESVIYRNGVFPSQGVRPVFSTINAIVENSLPEFILHAIDDKVYEIKVFADFNKSSICCSYTKNNTNVVHSKEIDFVIDKIREKQSKSSNALISTHEIGHAVAYMVLFNTTPKQICSTAISGGNEGFVFPHEYRSSKDYILKYVKVCLAGKACEEIVFGDSFTSSGSFGDIDSATVNVTQMVRHENMDGFTGFIVTDTTSGASERLTNSDETNTIIEQILKEQKKEVTDILNKNILLIKDLLREMNNKSNLASDEIFKISVKHLPDLRLLPFDSFLEPNYSEILDNFLKR